MSAVLADLGPEVQILLCSKKLFPNQVLPPEYGGTGSTVQELTKYWIDQVTFLVVLLWYFLVLDTLWKSSEKNHYRSPCAKLFSSKICTKPCAKLVSNQ